MLPHSGAGLGITYSLPRNFTLNANYSWATFEEDEKLTSALVLTRLRINSVLVLGNRKVIENLGFNINFRWQEGFLWQSSYGVWNVPEFGVLDAQISYKTIRI
jgi:iron complex outermembrane receptor protein